MVLSRVSPLAVPVLLEIGRESVRPEAMKKRCWPRRRRSSPRRPARRNRHRVPAIHRANHASPANRWADRPTSPRRPTRPAIGSVLVTAAPIHLAGERLMLDPTGALFWPEQRLLAVSDLHLEKGSSFARRGMLLPPWDTHATLDRLTLLLRRWRPRWWSRWAIRSTTPRARLGCRRASSRLRAMTEAHRLHLGAGQSRPCAAGSAARGMGAEPHCRAAGVPPSGQRRCRSGRSRRPPPSEGDDPGAGRHRSAGRASSLTGVA